MSKDKHRSFDRAMDFMLKRFSSVDYITKKPLDWILLDHEGGISSSNPELKLLVKWGLVSIPLSRGTPVRSLAGWNKIGSYYRSLHGHASRRKAYLTAAGKEILADLVENK